MWTQRPAGASFAAEEQPHAALYFRANVMAEDQRPHFEITDRHIREDDVRVTGRLVTYPRADFGQHGAQLLNTTRQTRAALSESLDYASTAATFVQVRTPPEQPISREKFKLRSVGIEVVALTARPDAAIARLSKEHYDELESRILRYAIQPTHPYRSYLSVIDAIEPVPADARKLE